MVMLAQEQATDLPDQTPAPDRIATANGVSHGDGSGADRSGEDSGEARSRVRRSKDDSSSGSSDDDDGQSNWIRCRMEKRSVNPLSLRFSQAVIYRTFHNGLNVDDVIGEIRGRHIPAESPFGAYCPRRAAQANVHLFAPFPYIRVLSGNRNLKYLDGRGSQPDQVSEEQELLYTIDNRRLYVLQQAALRRWPKRCLVDVFVMERLPYKRHARKFDNYKDGYTVQLGHGRNSSDITMWCWFEQACLREQEAFFMPVDCVLALAKLVPSFLLLRDRLRPFLHESSLTHLIVCLIWACILSWLRMATFMDKLETKVLQNHVLSLVNNDCLHISDTLPEPVASAFGCPTRPSKTGVPSRICKATWPQVVLTVFYAWVSFILYVIWFLPEPWAERTQRTLLIIGAMVATFLFRYATGTFNWMTEVKTE